MAIIDRPFGDRRPKGLAIARVLEAASTWSLNQPWCLAGRRPARGRPPCRNGSWDLLCQLGHEFGIIFALLLGWDFTLAVFVGDPDRDCSCRVAYRFRVPPLIARGGPLPDWPGVGGQNGWPRCDGNAYRWGRPQAAAAFTGGAHFGVPNLGNGRASSAVCVLGGLLLAGAFGDWVPGSFRRHPFLVVHCRSVWVDPDCLVPTNDRTLEQHTEHSNSTQHTAHSNSTQTSAAAPGLLSARCTLNMPGTVLASQAVIPQAVTRWRCGMRSWLWLQRGPAPRW